MNSLQYHEAHFVMNSNYIVISWTTNYLSFRASTGKKQPFPDATCIQHTWEPEGHYCSSKMFCWKAEGHYCCTKSMVIAPFWFSIEYLSYSIMPFWLSTDHIMVIRMRWGGHCILLFSLSIYSPFPPPPKKKKRIQLLGHRWAVSMGLKYEVWKAT